MADDIVSAMIIVCDAEMKNVIIIVSSSSRVQYTSIHQ